MPSQLTIQNQSTASTLAYLEQCIASFEDAPFRDEPKVWEAGQGSLVAEENPRANLDPSLQVLMQASAGFKG